MSVGPQSMIPGGDWFHIADTRGRDNELIVDRVVAFTSRLTGEYNETIAVPLVARKGLLVEPSAGRLVHKDQLADIEREAANRR